MDVNMHMQRVLKGLLTWIASVVMYTFLQLLIFLQLRLQFLLNHFSHHTSYSDFGALFIWITTNKNIYLTTKAVSSTRMQSVWGAEEMTQCSSCFDSVTSPSSVAMKRNYTVRFFIFAPSNKPLEMAINQEIIVCPHLLTSILQCVM